MLATIDVDALVAEHRATQEMASQAVASQATASQATASQVAASQVSASQEAMSQEIVSLSQERAGATSSSEAAHRLLPDDEDDDFANFNLEAAISGSGHAVFHDEFQAICSTDLAPGELMTIVAAAGSGKSTVLKEYAKRRPHLRILYLTFGKDVKKEKAKEYSVPGLEHVKVQPTPQVHTVAGIHMSSSMST